MNTENLNKLVASIYGSVITPERRLGVLEKVQEILGAKTANWFIPNHDSTMESFLAFTGDAEMLLPYAEHYMDMDSWHLLANGRKRGEIVEFSEHFNKEHLRSDEFYNDYIVKTLGVVSVCTVLLAKHENLSSHIGGYGRAGDELISEDVRKQMTFLAPHFIQFYNLFQALEGSNLKEIRLLTAMDRMSEAVFILDASLKILFLNADAEEIVRRKDGLESKLGILSATTTIETNELSRLVGSSASIGGDKGDFGGAMRISRPFEKKAHSLLVAPLRDEKSLYGGNIGTAIAIISNPRRNNHVSADVYQKLFKFTAAETRLSQLLVSGSTLADAAELAGIRSETARGYLKSIYQKTDTKGQAQLVSVLAKIRSPIKHPAQK